MDGVAQLRAQTKEEQESKVEPSESKAKAKAKAMCHRQQKTRGTSVSNQQGRRKLSSLSLKLFRPSCPEISRDPRSRSCICRCAAQEESTLAVASVSVWALTTLGSAMSDRQTLRRA